MMHPAPSQGAVRSTQRPSLPGAKMQDCPTLVHVVTSSVLFKPVPLSGGHPHNASVAEITRVRIRHVYH
jgi:hypothetical protein